MFIIIRQEGLEFVKRRYNAGFTLPEILVSFMIFALALQFVWQWGMILEQSQYRIEEQQQALLYAQQALANQQLQLSPGWKIQERQDIEEINLSKRTITIMKDRQLWSFVFVGRKELNDVSEAE